MTPPGQSRDIRPTADRAREALFSILGGRLDGSRVLDLFAGTGALGLEALSRGAAEVVFVDFFRQSLEIIRRNIEICRPGREDATLTLLKHDLRKGLPARFARDGASHQFDLIVLDPPYSLGLSLKTLEFLGNGHLLHESGIIVAEERASETLPDTCGLLYLADQRSYGDTGFWIYRCHQPPVTPIKESS